MADARVCFYCASVATIWIVKVGDKDYPICRECKFGEAHKDGFVTRPK